MTIRRNPHAPIFRRDKVTGRVATPTTGPTAPPEIIAIGYRSEVDWDADFETAKWVSMMGDSGKVIVGTEGRWRLVDYGTDPDNPTTTASETQPDEGSMGVDHAWFDSTYFLGRTDSAEVSVYSASGSSITLVSSIEDFDYANQVYRMERVNASLVAVGGYSLGLIDVSNPASVGIAGGLTELEKGSGLINAMAVSGDGSLLAFVDDTDLSLLRMVDISNPASPSEIDTLDLPVVIANMVIVGDRLYAVNAFNDDIAIVDISTPSAMSALTSYSNTDLDDPAAIVAVDTTHLVTGGVASLNLLDQPPTTVFTPGTMPTWPTGSTCLDLSYSAGNLMIATGWSPGSPNEYRLRFFELLTA